MRRAGHVGPALIGDMNSAHKILVGKPKRKRPLGRPRRRWEDYIEKELIEIGCEDWTEFICIRTGTSSGLD
jgi:hypothetical protein